MSFIALSPLRKYFTPVIAVVLGTTAGSMRADYTAVVSPGTVLVTNFQGWGSSLCWWANVVGGYSNREDYVNLAFQQLKLNIVRYNIGGGENPNLTNTITNYRAIMQGFEPSNGVWNWDADKNQRWVLRTAVAMGANLVVAFANSPPWWMTVSGSVTGAMGGTNNLQVGYENTFAVYLATVVSNLTALDGVHFNYVTPMNEPTDAWTYDNGKQEGCHMSASQQSAVVGYLNTQLKLMAPSAGIDAPEDYSEQDSINDLNSYSSSSLSSVALVTTHTYDANNAPGLKSLAETMGRPLWVSEYGDNDGTGLTMAQRIHSDITGMGANAWIYWQVVDNASGWGFLYNPLTTNILGFDTVYTINQKFYVMGQYSEFIRPGCNIINVNDTNTLAAYNPADATLVLVVVNTNTTNFNVTYNLSAFNSAPAQAAVYQTSSSESLAALPSIPITNQEIISAIPAQSVTTFVVTFPGLLQPEPYSINLLSYRPLAYWRLCEPPGSASAYEYVGGFAGTYGSGTTNGQPGIPNPPFLGVPQGDLGVWLDHSGGSNGFVTTPALNATVSNATLMCWVYPNGSQNNSEGLVFSRGPSGAVNGINYAANNSFGYTWANNSATYDWTSGMVIPTNTWSLLALVITPSNAAGYVFNTNGQFSATNTVANPNETFSTGFAIGADPQTSTLSTRIFNGEMDNVAIFNYALTPAQLSQIYSVALSGLSLRVQTSGANMTVTWPLGALYTSPTPNGPWSAVPGATSPHTATTSAGSAFFRVIAAP